MPLILNLTDLVKLLRQFYGDEHSIEFLDALETEARALCDAWDAIYKELLDSGVCDLHACAERMPTITAKLLLTGRLSVQAHFYTSLEELYRRISMVFARKSEDEARANLACSLGKLMHQRMLTKEQYEKTIRNLGSPVFLNETNSIEQLLDLRNAITVLHKEAAFLKAAAIDIRRSFRSTS